MPKRVLYVITKSNWGGAQKYVFEMALTDKKNRMDVAVACGGNGEMYARLSEIGVRVFGIDSLIRDVSLFREIKSFINLLKIFFRFKPHTIHLNSSKIGILGSIAGRIYNLFSKQKSRIIFTAHGWAFNEERNFLSIFLIKVASYLTIILSHKTIVLSQFEFAQVAKWPGCNKKLIKQKLEISEIDFLSRDDAKKILIEKIGVQVPLDCKWIVTIAELHKNKGLEYGIEACKKVRGEKFIWIIIGDGELRNKIAHEITQNNLIDKVFLLGYMRDASKLLMAADVFMLPSIKEGLPYVLLEAQRAELPIIATNVGGISEYFTDSDNFIVKSKSSDALAEAIKSIL